MPGYTGLHFFLCCLKKRIPLITPHDPLALSGVQPLIFALAVSSTFTNKMAFCVISALTEYNNIILYFVEAEQ